MSIDDPLYVQPPKQVQVLLRDLLADDNLAADAISIGEELQRQLPHWLEDLRAAEREKSEAQARELRRQLRRTEGR